MMHFLCPRFIRLMNSAMVTLIHSCACLMRPVWPLRLFFHPVFARHKTLGFYLSVLAALTMLSIPAHGLMSAQQARAVTLCTAQGMMTVWMDETDQASNHDFADLKRKASQQCLGCLIHLPNVAPPIHRATLSVVPTQQHAAITPSIVDIATPQWRWASPRAPPA